MNKELIKGIKIEMEHKVTYERLSSYVKLNKKLPPMVLLSQWIAEDHLREHTNYYTILEESGL